MQTMNLPEPISALSSEHSAITEKLEDLVRCCHARRRPDTDELTETARGFVALLSAHVAKEETLLFGPARAALGDHACALEILETEHETVADLRTEFVRLINVDPADRGVRYRRVLAKLTGGSPSRPHIQRRQHPVSSAQSDHFGSRTAGNGRTH